MFKNRVYSIIKSSLTQPLTYISYYWYEIFILSIYCTSYSHCNKCIKLLSSKWKQYCQVKVNLLSFSDIIEVEKKDIKVDYVIVGSLNKWYYLQIVKWKKKAIGFLPRHSMDHLLTENASLCMFLPWILRIFHIQYVLLIIQVKFMNFDGLMVFRAKKNT